MTRAPRIDTLRNQLAATTRLLELVNAGLHTLHTLAYDRTAADEIRVRGGQPDYALDTNGDPRARDAYRHLARAIDDTCVRLTFATHEAINILNAGGSPGLNRQHPATVTVVEHARAIEAQARRIRNGGFNPGRTLPQPKEHAADRVLIHELDTLKRRNTKLERQLQSRDRRIADLNDRLRRSKGPSTSSTDVT